MPHHPSRRLESILSALLPPACREHVLGDLAECAETRGQYIGVFLAILPKVVLSATRRKLRQGTGVGLMAGLSAVALVIAALTTRGPALPELEWLRWAAPWTVWVTGCALAATYGAAGTRFWSGWGVLFSLLVAIGTAALSGAHVRGTAAALVVATIAHMAITLPKLGADIMSAIKAGTPPLTMDTVHERARHFQRMIWWRNARESVVGFALIGVNANTLRSLSFDSPAQWVPPALGVAGLACVLYMLHAKAGSRRVPAGDARTVLRFHQGEIERQREVLHRVPYWYLLPLAPTMIAGALAKWDPVATPLTLAIMALVFYGIARLNKAGAGWLDHQLEQARALE
jgi:hypothetical protein